MDKLYKGNIMQIHIHLLCINSMSWNVQILMVNYLEAQYLNVIPEEVASVFVFQLLAR